MASLSGINNFTFKKEEKVEQHIYGLLSKVVDMIIADINPESIVLSGSFGRGEGTAYLENGRVVIDSDFEIGCVCKDYSRRMKIFSLENRLRKDFDIEITLNFFLPRRFTSRDSSNLSSSRSILTIDQFDLLYGSKFIYGKDYGGSIVYPEANEIFPWEYVRLIFNRTAELIESLLFYDHNSASRKMCKSLNKLLIAFGDYYLMKDNQYHYSYAERMHRFVVLSTQAKGDCPFKINNFHSNIIRAYEMKLGVREYDNLSAEAIFSTINTLASVYKDIMEKELKVKFEDWGSFFRAYLNISDLSLKCRYFRGRPFMQNLLAFAKNGFYPFKNVVHLYSSKIPMCHRAYARLPEWLFKDFLGIRTQGCAGALKFPIFLHHKGEKLFNDWRYWAYYL
jgi:hypothetical protein